MGDETTVELTGDQWDLVQENRDTSAASGGLGEWVEVLDAILALRPVPVRPWQPGDLVRYTEHRPGNECLVVLTPPVDGWVITASSGDGVPEHWAAADLEAVDEVPSRAAWFKSYLVAAGRPGAADRTSGVDEHGPYEWTKFRRSEQPPGTDRVHELRWGPGALPVGDATIEPDWEEIAAAIDHGFGRRSKSQFTLQNDDFTDAVAEVVGPLLTAPAGGEDDEWIDGAHPDVLRSKLRAVVYERDHFQHQRDEARRSRDLAMTLNAPAGTPSGIEWGDFTLNPGDKIRHATSWGDYWETVVGLGPDNRLVTVDPDNKLCRYSDPTDRWVVPVGRLAAPRRSNSIDEGSDQ